MTRKIADTVEIEIVYGENKAHEIIVDGEPFPWFTNGLTWSQYKGKQPEIVVTIPTWALKITHRAK